MLSKRELFLPYCLPLVGEEEEKEVLETLRSGWLSTGPKTQQLEQDIAVYTGAKYAVGVTSCTAALHLALLAHGISKGDEVIVPSFTFAATANMVVNVGAIPVFADIDKDLLVIDPVDIESKITSKTKAIIPVHYAGHPANVNSIQKIAEKHNLIVIEDAAHAIGSKYDGKSIGGHGNTTCFSFYATKNMCTGEGGMLTTDDDKVADFAKKNRLHGISKDAWKRYSKEGSWRYEVEYAGWKYNMFDLQAALGIHQLKKLDSFIETRTKYAHIYDEFLSGISGVTIPSRAANITHSYHLYPILLEKMERDQFIQRMSEYNIGTSVHFIPLHLQPFYQKNFGYKYGDLPVTEGVFEHIVSLPLYPKMSEEDMTYVIEALREVLS